MMEATPTNGCFVTGGPDWLFPLLLGSGGAALVCVLMVLASGAPLGSRPAVRTTPRRQLIALAVGLVPGIALGVAPVHLLALYAPLLLVAAVLRSARRPVTSSATSGSAAEPPRATIVVVGVLSGAVASGALAAMVLQGGAC